METKPRTETTAPASPMEWMNGRHANFDDDVSLQDNMSRLMDLLAALRADLTTGVLPRAARITGTSNRLVAAVGCIDAAIGLARDVVLQSQSRPGD